MPAAKRHCGPRSIVVFAAITFGKTHAHAASDCRVELRIWSLLVPQPSVSQPVHWSGCGSCDTTQGAFSQYSRLSLPPTP